MNNEKLNLDFLNMEVSDSNAKLSLDTLRRFMMRLLYVANLETIDAGQLLNLSDITLLKHQIKEKDLTVIDVYNLICCCLARNTAINLNLLESPYDIFFETEEGKISSVNLHTVSGVNKLDCPKNTMRSVEEEGIELPELYRRYICHTLVPETIYFGEDNIFLIAQLISYAGDTYPFTDAIKSPLMTSLYLFHKEIFHLLQKINKLVSISIGTSKVTIGDIVIACENFNDYTLTYKGKVMKVEKNICARTMALKSIDFARFNNQNRRK